MPFPKIDEARKLNDADLATEILKVKKDLFDLRLQQATSRLEKPHLFKQAKHKLAQFLTVEGERKRANQEQQPTRRKR